MVSRRAQCSSPCPRAMSIPSTIVTQWMVLRSSARSRWQTCSFLLNMEMCRQRSVSCASRRLEVEACDIRAKPTDHGGVRIADHAANTKQVSAESRAFGGGSAGERASDLGAIPEVSLRGRRLAPRELALDTPADRGGNARDVLVAWRRRRVGDRLTRYSNAVDANEELGMEVRARAGRGVEALSGSRLDRAEHPQPARTPTQPRRDGRAELSSGR